MLTKRENLLETIRGGHPDRYVNQYEYLAIVGDPIGIKINGRDTIIRGTSGLNGWGVTIEFPENVPGPFPNTAEDKVVVKDITRWREYVKSPGVIFPEEEWAPFVERANAVDRREQFVAPIVAPGLFEKLHYLVGMEATMIAFYEEPEAVKELIDFLADWEIEAAKETISHLHPDALFHHDDLGSQISSFVSPALFGSSPAAAPICAGQRRTAWS